MKDLLKKAAAFALAGLGALLLFIPAAWGQESPFQDTLALIDAFRTGGWTLISLAVVNLLTSLTKETRLLSWIPVRWRVVVPIVLGGIAGILSSILGGVPVLEAVWVGLLSGPGAIATHEVVTEAVLGTSRRRHPGK